MYCPLTAGSVIELRQGESVYHGEIRYCVPAGPDFRLGIQLIPPEQWSPGKHGRRYARLLTTRKVAARTANNRPLTFFSFLPAEGDRSLRYTVQFTGRPIAGHDAIAASALERSSCQVHPRSRVQLLLRTPSLNSTLVICLTRS